MSSALIARAPSPSPSLFSSSSPRRNPNCPFYPASLTVSQPLNWRRFRIFAGNGNNLNGSDAQPPGNGDDGKAKNDRPRLNLRWLDLVLDPDPDNIVAVGLTGLLAWAGLQVLWQLFVISGAILLAALKYTIVAALLIVILITLL